MRWFVFVNTPVVIAGRGGVLGQPTDNVVIK
jgi:hypothetical protein